MPDRAHCRTVVAVGHALARMRPGRAEVIAPPDRRAVPRAAAAGVQGAGRRIVTEVIDRPAFAQRAAQAPAVRAASTGRIAGQDEGALAGADQDQKLLAHADLLVSFGPRGYPSRPSSNSPS